MEDEREAHVCDRGAGVKAALGFHLRDDVLYRRELVLVQRKLSDDELVTLDDLARGKARGKARTLGVVLDEVGNRVDRTVYGASVVLWRAEVLAKRPLLVTGDVQRVTYELVYALARSRADGDHWHTQHGFQPVDVNRSAIAPQLVHHVERDHHGAIHLEALHGEVEVALDVGRIHDVDDGVWVLHQHIVA